MSKRSRISSNITTTTSIHPTNHTTNRNNSSNSILNQSNTNKFTPTTEGDYLLVDDAGGIMNNYARSTRTAMTGNSTIINNNATPNLKGSLAHTNAVSVDSNHTTITNSLVHNHHSYGVGVVPPSMNAVPQVHNNTAAIWQLAAAAPNNVLQQSYPPALLQQPQIGAIAAVAAGINTGHNQNYVPYPPPLFSPTAINGHNISHIMNTVQQQQSQAAPVYPPLAFPSNPHLDGQPQQTTAFQFPSNILPYSSGTGGAPYPTTTTIHNNHQAPPHSQPQMSKKRRLLNTNINTSTPTEATRTKSPTISTNNNNTHEFPARVGINTLYFYDSNKTQTNQNQTLLTADKSDDTSKMIPEEKRRYERNQREQQRSSRISNQINDLRQVLTEGNVPFKPNKFSILMSVVDYIKQLQSRSSFLDEERRKLVDTLRQTSDVVTSGTDSVAATAFTTSETTASPEEVIGNDSKALLKSGDKMNYSIIFHQCHAALGVAALDGRFLDCNSDFEVLSGYTKEELTHSSLFHLLSTNNAMDDVYQGLVHMLNEDTNSGSDSKKEKDENLNEGNRNNSSCFSNSSSGNNNSEEEDDSILRQSHWCSIISNMKNTDQRLLLNITLTRTKDGMPKFFNCALSEA